MRNCAYFICQFRSRHAMSAHIWWPSSCGHLSSSPGFCGGWFIWCRWLPVVIVPGGGGRVPRRLRARRGYACRRRSVAGWCPYQWTHSAVATTGGVDVLPRALVTDQLGLVQGVQSLGQSKAERSPPSTPPRRPPRSRTGPARSEWTCTAPHGRK